MTNQSRSECEEPEKEKKLLPNKMIGRVMGEQEEGNDPTHNRMNASEFRNQAGFVVGVFDGHGGFQVAQLCMRKLHAYIDEELKTAEDNEQSVKDAISRGFQRIETEWTNLARVAFQAGYADSAYVGASVVVSVIMGSKLYVANLGDCKAVLVSSQGDKLVTRKLTKTFSASKKSE